MPWSSLARCWNSLTSAQCSDCQSEVRVIQTCDLTFTKWRFHTIGHQSCYDQCVRVISFIISRQKYDQAYFEPSYRHSHYLQSPYTVFYPSISPLELLAPMSSHYTNSWLHPTIWSKACSYSFCPPHARATSNHLDRLHHSYSFYTNTEPSSLHSIHPGHSVHTLPDSRWYPAG